MGWLSGFGVTLRQIGRPKLTEHFPKEKRPKPVRASIRKFSKAQPVGARISSREYCAESA